MKVEKLFDIRFIVPPVLTLLLIFLYSPEYFLSRISESFLSVVIGSVVVLALGFLISSIVDLLINFKNARIPYGFSELQVWKAMDCEGKHITDQLHKRWHMVVANLNSYLAIILTPIVLSIFSFVGINPPATLGWIISYFFIIVILAALFLRNGAYTYESLMDMDKLILERNGFKEGSNYLIIKTSRCRR
jgi:hypothetical protein